MLYLTIDQLSTLGLCLKVNDLREIKEHFPSIMILKESTFIFSPI